jgi:hypothetical protein
MPPKRPPDSLGRPLNPLGEQVVGPDLAKQGVEASLAMPPKRPPDSLGRPLNPDGDSAPMQT